MGVSGEGVGTGHMQPGYETKSYLPQLARQMYDLGKYIFAHKDKAYAALDASTALTDEQKRIAKKIFDDILTNHEIFKALHTDLNVPKIGNGKE
jgi:hypothetical protein